MSSSKLDQNAGQLETCNPALLSRLATGDGLKSKAEDTEGANGPFVRLLGQRSRPASVNISTTIRIGPSKSRTPQRKPNTRHKSEPTMMMMMMMTVMVIVISIACHSSLSQVTANHANLTINDSSSGSPTIHGSAYLLRRKKPMKRALATAGAGPSKKSKQKSHQQQWQQQKEKHQSAKLELEALHYLQRYGYLNESSNSASLIEEETFHRAIVAFQRFAGLPESGQLDSLTVKYMQMARCGNRDMMIKFANDDGGTQISSSNNNNNDKQRRRKRRKKRRKKRRRKRRYALQGSKWRRQELTYRIGQYPSRFANKRQHEVDREIERAFRLWSKVAPIDFVVKKEGRVHIEIKFAGGEHGDGDPFDGPGNTLAHAYFPQYGGDAHFDDQEYWTVDSYTGTNIFQVAAHELGHSLGLGHSSVREALMAPFYQKYKPNFKLHPDDVQAIRALYGERDEDENQDEDGEDGSTTTTTTTSTSTSTTSTTSSTDSTPRRPTPPPPPSRPEESPTRGSGSEDDNDGGAEEEEDKVDQGVFGPRRTDPGGPVDLCQEAKIDAVTRVEDGTTYVFRGQYYWQVKNEGLESSGRPTGKIARDWDQLPGDLDAALTWSDGKTFFFKGDKYWRYTNKRRELGYPKLISVGFAGIPNNIDAAFVWGGNGKTYFIKRDKYWRFDSKQEPPVSSQYPKPLKNWIGLPSRAIDAAFKWENGMTYFFKDDLYYRFDDRKFQVDSAAKPAFPRSTAEWWFGCTNSNLPLKRSKASLTELSGNNNNNNNKTTQEWSLLSQSGGHSKLGEHSATARNSLK